LVTLTLASMPHFRRDGQNINKRKCLVRHSSICIHTDVALLHLTTAKIFPENSGSLRPWSSGSTRSGQLPQVRLHGPHPELQQVVQSRRRRVAEVLQSQRAERWTLMNCRVKHCIIPT
jgi:hypothetical protein